MAFRELDMSTKVQLRSRHYHSHVEYLWISNTALELYNTSRHPDIQLSESIWIGLP
jgi:hypothetical protein